MGRFRNGEYPCVVRFERKLVKYHGKEVGEETGLGIRNSHNPRWWNLIAAVFWYARRLILKYLSLSDCFEGL